MPKGYAIYYLNNEVTKIAGYPAICTKLTIEPIEEAVRELQKQGHQVIGAAKCTNVRNFELPMFANEFSKYL